MEERAAWTCVPRFSPSPVTSLPHQVLPSLQPHSATSQLPSPYTYSAPRPGGCESRGLGVESGSPEFQCCPSTRHLLLKSPGTKSQPLPASDFLVGKPGLFIQPSGVIMNIHSHVQQMLIKHPPGAGITLLHPHSRGLNEHPGEAQHLGSAQLVLT